MQKYANLAELEKCCQTHIFLQNFVSIQPRTSPLKICKILQNFAKFANFADPNPLTLQCERAKATREPQMLKEDVESAIAAREVAGQLYFLP